MLKYYNLLFLILFGLYFNIAQANNDVVYFYNWTEYVPPGLLEQFTQETGIKVIYSTYESNESMYTKLKTWTHAPYDLVVPSSYFVAKMRKEHMLQQIDKNILTNFKYLDPNLLNKPFDPNNNYSIPYMWGVTAIGVNSDYINPKSINSWADFWKSKYKKSLLLIDDAREIFQIALLKMGKSGNTQNLKQIDDAYKELKNLMPNVLAFNSDNPGTPYIEGEVKIGMIWNGSAYIARKSGIPLHIIWPKEGSILWMDNLAIPSTSKNKIGALKLINFLLRPEISAKIAETTGYPTANLEAKKFLKKEIVNDPFLYPPIDVIKKGEWQNDVGKISMKYETLFQKLKTEY
ncbi:MAG: extracellular solute-binding protein [Pantoea sp. Brub]|nr:extracellular solute-binding protein [Pantoea sp. Brub]